MKRNMDLVREILLSFENVEAARVSKKSIVVDGYKKEEIDFHIELLVEAGLLNHHIAKPETTSGRPFLMRFDMGIRPTMIGYDFADSVRDPEVWSKTKKGAERAGGFTIDLLKDLAKGLIKKKIEEHTGIQI
ncbi:DUF2513 domain-containing protein [Bosea sp. (in: a-proteobacteria)]|jgi:hypothetical protein|uniref:DUF2513 domain-containing protein n=1 Tax=Bosea sp. (in: a-proteobacteria) TaxID=1871050 RepID=UPI002DDDBA68|nr:DUF2513 domain-containing protein [Bosea sp. (in: a-proteobacteria)]HEV2512451.1 DUF2513 domain-containing protein [Bosea sp. (in: a-proteobacteria)]